MGNYSYDTKQKNKKLVDYRKVLAALQCKRKYHYQDVTGSMLGEKVDQQYVYELFLADKSCMAARFGKLIMDCLPLVDMEESWRQEGILVLPNMSQVIRVPLGH